MSIKITQQNKNWKMEIIMEEWEFEDRKTMSSYLDKLLDMKENFGQIKYKQGVKQK